MPAAALSSVVRVLRLSPDPEVIDEIAEAAVRVLLRGGIVALPTDTLYGVSTTLANSKKLYSLKRRPAGKPLGLFLSSHKDIHKWAISTIPDSLAQKLLPGPVTLLFKRHPSLPFEFNPSVSSVGVRVPQSQLVMELCRRLGQPLAQTSANVSGSSINPIRIADFEDLFPEIDLVIDGGTIGDGYKEGSTIVDLTVEGEYGIIRDGCARVQVGEILREGGLLPSVKEMIIS